MDVAALLAEGYVPDAPLDGLFADPVRAATVVAFYVRHACQAGEVLDIGAGAGRLAIPLAEQGIPVCCLEPSPPMREALRAKLLARPHLQSRITLHDVDVASFFAGRRPYRLACLAGVWHQLPDDRARRAALSAIARALAPGGLLILEDPHVGVEVLRCHYPDAIQCLQF